MKDVLDVTEVAREVRRGALVGVLHDFLDVAFEWQSSPAWVNEHHPLKQIESWLASVNAEATYVTDSQWIKWVAHDQTVAIVLEPDC